MKTPKTITKYQARKAVERLAMRERVITKIMLETGIRISDALSLTVGDINAVIREKKTGKRKHIKLSGWTVNLIRRYLGGRKSGLLFPSKRNIKKPIARSTYFRALRRDLTPGGIIMSAHSCRKLRKKYMAQNARYICGAESLEPQIHSNDRGVS